MNLYLVSHESETNNWSTYVRAADYFDAMNTATKEYPTSRGGILTITHLAEYIESEI